MSSSAPSLYVAEPSAAFLYPAAVVIDCSVLAGLVFREPWCDDAKRHTEGRHLHAPHLLLQEISSVTLKKLRRLETHALDGLEQALHMRIELHSIHTREAFELAQRYTLSAYDASYLWLAAELQCPLITFDDALAHAAHRHLSQLE